MGALPIQEDAGLPHASCHAGRISANRQRLRQASNLIPYRGKIRGPDEDTPMAASIRWVK